MGLRTLLLAIALLAGIAGPAAAVQPDEVLDDPALEGRAREISTGLRCLVCQNQSIDDSDAPLARDLRLLVRERIEAGDTNEEAVAFIVDRYGEFVLLKPPFAWHTLLLWVAPLLLLIVGGTIILVSLRSRRAPEDTELTPEERRALEDLTGERG